jgi:hypothetical protein
MFAERRVLIMMGWAGGERVLALIPREATLMEKGEGTPSQVPFWVLDLADRRSRSSRQKKIEECKLLCFDCPAPLSSSVGK